MENGQRFDQFLVDTLSELGFDVVPGFRMLKRPWHWQTGWPLDFIEVDWKPNTLLLVHASDFVTVSDEGRVIELENLEHYYGARSGQILFTHWERNLADFYHGPINLCWWSNHNYDTVLQARARIKEWLPQLQWPRPYAWQCLNGRIEKHRIVAADTLKDWPNGWLSLGDELPLPEFAYASYRGTENDENFVRLMYIYGRTAVNIITETKFRDLTGIVTEKTLQACMAEQIPILLGHKGIHDHARDMGLDIFDDLVDISYQDVPGWERAKAAIECNRDLILGRVDLTPYVPRLIKQREYVLWELPKLMLQRFKEHALELAKRLLPSYVPDETV